jgi:hypothetical protein
MVLPTAAAMPNHMPSTCSSRPRAGAAKEEPIVVGAAWPGWRPPDVAGASDVLDNGASQTAQGMHSRIGSRVDGAHDNGGAGKCKVRAVG